MAWGNPPESAWCEETEAPPPRSSASPADRVHNRGAASPPATPQGWQNATLQTSFSPPQSPSHSPQRKSWQDLDANGNYHLHFFLKRGDPAGLQLVETYDQRSHGILIVDHVESSGQFAFTSSGSPGLFPGDVIMQVNRQGGPAIGLRDIVNQVAANGGQLFIVVQSRPAAFDVMLKREGPNSKKLGLSVAIDRAEIIPRMQVRTVRNEGLIPEWNDKNGSLRICAGDFIMQVNGFTRAAEDMYAMISESVHGDVLELRIETPPRDAMRHDPEMASPFLNPAPAENMSPRTN